MDKESPRLRIDPTPPYKPQTVHQKAMPQPTAHKQTAHATPFNHFEWLKTTPLTKFLGIVIIVLVVMLMLSYFETSYLGNERDSLLNQTTSLEKTMQEKEKTITALEKEKLDLTTTLDDEKKGRNIAERQASLTELNKEDAELRVQSTQLEIEQLTQELQFEKKRNEDLDELIVTMKNNTETLKTRITDLNNQLNQCILNS